jgi:hypothetical protein
MAVILSLRTDAEDRLTALLNGSPLGASTPLGALPVLKILQQTPFTWAEN